MTQPPRPDRRSIAAARRLRPRQASRHRQARLAALKRSEIPKSGPVAIAVTPYVGGPLRVRADGVGPITERDGLRRGDDQGPVPQGGGQERLHPRAGEGPPGPIITVEQDNVPLLEIGKDDRGRHRRDPHGRRACRGPQGRSPSRPSGPISASTSPSAGPARAAPSTRRSACAPEAPTVSYVFGVPGWTKGGLPPVEDAEGQGPAQRIRLASGRESRRRRGLIRCSDA
jgi:hypothetical protein